MTSTRRTPPWCGKSRPVSRSTSSWASVLFGGTVLTVLVAPIDFGYHWRNVAIGLTIATIKASCVALIFMHLSHERGMIYKFLLFTVIFFAAMLFLLVLGLKDPIHFDFYKPLTGPS